MSEETSVQSVSAVPSSGVVPEVAIGGIRVYGSLEARSALWTAIAKARAAFKPIGKTVTGRKGNIEFKYAPLAAIFDGVDAALADAGVGFHQDVVTPASDRTSIVTILAGHGAEVWSELQFGHPCVQFEERGFTVKDYGAILTYYRRYAAQTAFGVEGDRDLDDDPGETNQPTQPPQGRRQTPQTSQAQQAQQRQPARPQTHSASSPRTQEQKPAEAPKEAVGTEGKQPNPMYSDGVTLELIEAVRVALCERNKISSVADIASEKAVKVFGKSDKAVGVALATIVAQGKAQRVNKGQIPCYLGNRPVEALGDYSDPRLQPGATAEEYEQLASEPPPEGHVEQEKQAAPVGARTEAQENRILELYKMHPEFQGLAADELKSAMRLDCKRKLDIVPKDLDGETAEKLIELLEGEVG